MTVDAIKENEAECPYTTSTPGQHEEQNGKSILPQREPMFDRELLNRVVKIAYHSCALKVAHYHTQQGNMQVTTRTKKTADMHSVVTT